MGVIRIYRIGICDDEKSICSMIEEMLVSYSKNNGIKIEVEIWFTGETLCNYLEKDHELDILFLDIELIKMSGIQVANFIRGHMENMYMQIIYISYHISYAPQLFKTQPLEFLVKPITQQQINEVMILANKVIGKYVGVFEFQRGKEYYHIPYKKIMYFTIDGKKIKLVTYSTSITFYGKFKDIILSLPKDFIKIHQSYVVNKRFITEYAYDFIEMADGSNLAISKLHRKIVRKEILGDGWYEGF